MKKLSLLIILAIIISPMSAFAQDYKTKADRLYKSGEYEQAIVQYRAALAFLKSKNIAETERAYSEIERQIARASKCLPLKNDADKLYSYAQTADDYGSARSIYQEILTTNRDDSHALTRVQACNAQIAQIEMQKAEAQMWDKIVQGQRSKDIYKQYLAEFPKGAHAKDVEYLLQEVEDEELWAAAVKADTRIAYLTYLENPNTSIYNSEAQMAINKIDDGKIWASVVAKDTEEAYQQYLDNPNPAKGYQKEAAAKLSVFKTRRMIASLASGEASAQASVQASEIVATLETAQKSITLSDEDTKQLAYYKSIADYEKFYASPNLKTGLTYLETYPESEYAVRVSDKVSELYANGLSVNYTENDYMLAMSYAKSLAAQRYVENRAKDLDRRAKELKKSTKASVRRDNWSDRAQIGIGVDAELLSNIAFGPRLEFKLGTYSDFLNFSIGAKALWWSGPLMCEEGMPSVYFNQIPVYAALKFNLFDSGPNSRFYIAGEGAYNWNMKAKFDGMSIDADDMFVNKTNVSVTGRVGFCWEHGDFSIYYRQDMNPVFNQEYVYENYNSFYFNNEPAINERFRIGIAYTLYFSL